MSAPVAGVVVTSGVEGTVVDAPPGRMGVTGPIDGQVVSGALKDSKTLHWKHFRSRRVDHNTTDEALTLLSYRAITLPIGRRVYRFWIPERYESRFPTSCFEELMTLECSLRLIDANPKLVAQCREWDQEMRRS